MAWLVEISFDTSAASDWSKFEDEAERAAKRATYIGSGTDLRTGWRDIAWELKTLPAAERLAGKLVRLATQWFPPGEFGVRILSMP